MLLGAAFLDGNIACYIILHCSEQVTSIIFIGREVRGQYPPGIFLPRGPSVPSLTPGSWI